MAEGNADDSCFPHGNQETEVSHRNGAGTFILSKGPSPVMHFLELGATLHHSTISDRLLKF